MPPALVRALSQARLRLAEFPLCTLSIVHCTSTNLHLSSLGGLLGNGVDYSIDSTIFGTHVRLLTFPYFALARMSGSCYNGGSMKPFLRTYPLTKLALLSWSGLLIDCGLIKWLSTDAIILTLIGALFILVLCIAPIISIISLINNGFRKNHDAQYSLMAGGFFLLIMLVGACS